jgi:hypothetical protein
MPFAALSCTWQIVVLSASPLDPSAGSASHCADRSTKYERSEIFDRISRTATAWTGSPAAVIGSVLDEILRAIEGADDRMIAIEEDTGETLAQAKQHLREVKDES